MYISSVRINNYKSFNQSPLLDLKQGFNIIVGKNNAGKTALLEVLSTQFQYKPHLSSKTAPRAGSLLHHASTADIVFIFGHDELIEILRNFNSVFHVPIPSNISVNTTALSESNKQGLIEKRVTEALSRPTAAFKLQLQNGAPVPTRFPSYEEDDDDRTTTTRYYVSCSFKNGQLEFGERLLEAKETPEISGRILGAIRSRIYCFRAERMHIARCPVGIANELKPNAENLAEALQNLQTNVHRFQRYNNYVREVLSDVTQIAVRNIGSNRAEVVVLTEDPSQERIDLAVPLDECGTGVS